MEDEPEKKQTLAIFEFQWNLTKIPKNKTMTIISKMIEFKGEKLFRAGLNNQNEASTSSSVASSTLLFVTTNLAKMGLKVETVLYSDMLRVGLGMGKMDLVIQEAAENSNGKVQLYTAQLGSFATGTERYKFHVYVTGIVEDYKFYPNKDSLINEQLWLSAKNQVGTDFEIIAGKKIFPVHKFILAARSPVFDALFNEEKMGSNKKLKFESDVDESCMEKFLKFVYTGELEEAIVNPNKLKELASIYQIKTLEGICEAASSTQIDEDEMVKLVLQFQPLVGSSSVEIMQDTGLNLIDSSNKAVLNYEWKWNKSKLGTMSTDFKYEKVELFRGVIRITTICGQCKVTLALHNHFRKYCGFEVQQVNCSMGSGRLSSDWNWMLLQEKLVPREIPRLQIFFMQKDYFEEDPPPSLILHVQVVNTIPNYDFKFFDSTWKEQIWSAAIAKKFTDVEFLIGDQSVAAHRFVLCARSPVFAAMFNSGMAEALTRQVRIDDDIDVNIFRTFLEFLYVGVLKSFDEKEKLFALADKYQVETLMALRKLTIKQPEYNDDFNYWLSFSHNLFIH